MTQTFQYVIDANLCIKYFIPDVLSTKVDQLFRLLENPSVQLYVPDLLYIETTNALGKYLRAKQLTLEQVQYNLGILKTFAFQSVPTLDLIESAIAISAETGISAYDACYVALAQQIDAPLPTLDEQLFNALSSGSYNVQLFRDFELPRLP